MTLTLSSYISKSLSHLKASTITALRLPDYTKPLPLFSFVSIASLSHFLIGSDADYGGNSTAFWAFSKSNTALFYGRVDTELPTGMGEVKQVGYAAIRSRELMPVFFQSVYMDVSPYRYIRLRAKGKYH